MAVRKPPNPWSEKQVEIGIAVALFAAGVWFRLPGVGLYLAAAVFVRFGWPKPEEIYDIEGSAFTNAGKAQLHASHLVQPFGAKAWFGAVGPEGNSWWPPIRISAWWALLLGLCAGLTELLVMASTGIAMPYFAIDALAVFLLAQALAAGARDAAYADFNMQGTFPAAVVDADVVGRLGTTKIIWAPLATAIGITVIGTVATIRITAGIDGFAIPFTTTVAAWTAIGLLTGASIGARRYIVEFAAPQREFLTNAQLWAERWMSVRLGQVPPPQYSGEFPQPPDGNGDKTHTMAIFAVPAGGTITKYKEKTEELMSAVATEPGTGKYVLIAPMPDTDAAGQPIAGSRNEQQFKVVWNTVPLPAAPHLAGDLDNWTLAYAIHQAFDRAFNALKLGMPDLVRPIPLVRTPDRALFETIWNLPQGTTYDKVMKQAEAIAEKIDAPWLRIGRRTHDSDGRILPDTAISICFGHHPDTVEVDPNTRAFLEALDLHAAFYALKLGAPVLEEAVRLTKPGRPPITEARFRLSAAIDWAAVSKKTAALAEKIEVDYLRITRRDDGDGNPSSLVSVIYGCHPADTVMLGDPPGYDPEQPLVGPETNTDRLFLDALDWDDYFRACGLVGSDRRSPTVISKHVNKQGVASYECRTVPGLPISDLIDGVEALKATSGLGYVEIEVHPKDAALFKLLAAKIDPLDRPYLAVDYAQGPKPGKDLPVLHEPIPGVPDIDWAVGPGAEGDLLIDKWEGDNPHLFIGGASGSGKALALDTPVPGPDGTKHLGDLVVGDRVWDGSHRPTTVVGLSPVWDDRPAYRVTFSDGTSVVADAAHDWVVDDLTATTDVDGVTTAEAARGLLDGTGRTTTATQLATDHGIDATAALTAVGADPDAVHVRDWILETYAQWAERTGRRRLVTTAALAIDPTRWTVPRATGSGEGQGLPDGLDWPSVVAGLYAGAAHGENTAMVTIDTADLACDIAADAGIGARRTGTVPFRDGDRALVGFAAVPDPTCERSSAVGRAIGNGRYGPAGTDPRQGLRIVAVDAVDPVPVRCIEVDSPDHTFLITDAHIPTRNSITTLWMLLQLMHNNDPADVKFALADPKTELVYFEDAAHVNHFLGLTTPGFMANPYGAMADLLEHLKEETYRRNQSFTMHPAKPQKLTQARFIARMEIEHARAGTTPEQWPAGRAFPWWDGPPEAHPFMLPYQFIIIEECSTFFKKPANKEHHGDWERLIGHVEEMARIARSAGMHIAAMTQYPKKENIPTTLLAQCRRIGLSMNRVGSMLTIEESGLQDIKTPGRGKMSYGKSYKGVRCLFVRAPDEKDPDAPNDRDMFFEPVPKRDGAGRIEVGGRLPGTTGPTVVAAAPPDPSGVWLPQGGKSVMPGAVAPTGALPSSAATAAPDNGDVAIEGVPERAGGGAESDGPDWDRPDEDYPDLEDLLADLG